MSKVASVSCPPNPSRELEMSKETQTREFLNEAEDLYPGESLIAIDPSPKNLREAVDRMEKLVQEGKLEEAYKITVRIVKGIEKKLDELSVTDPKQYGTV